MKIPRLCQLWFFGSAMLPAGVSLAAESAESVWANLPPIVTSWLREDGLPQNAVSAVHQARNGYLWVGTYNGLARFDGARFEVFGPDRLPGLASNRITALWEDREGILWVGDESGNLVKVTEGGRTSEAVPRHWEAQPIIAIQEDAAGEKWILDRVGRLIRISDGLTRIVYEETVTEPGIRRLATDDEGSLWFLGYADLGGYTPPIHSRLVRLMSGEIEEWDIFGDPKAEIITSIAGSKRGGVWIVADDRIRRWKSGGWVEDRGILPFKGQHISSFYETRDGTIFIGILDVGVLLLAKGVESRLITTDDGLGNDWVNEMAEDREGNLWLATAGGLNSLRPRRVEMVAPDDEFGRKAILGLAKNPEGSLWVGTEGGGLYRFVEGAFRRYAEAEGLTKNFVWAVAPESEDRVWVGTWGQGLFLGEKDQFGVAPGWDPGAITVTALLLGRDGTLWAGTNLGLERWDGSEWTSWRKVDGRPLGHVRCLAEDSAGRLWFGISGGGLGLLEDEEIRQFGREDGLADQNVWALLSIGETLWIGTAGGGVGRLRNGRFSWLTSEHGLPDDMICSITFDGSGRFWFTSFSGIFSISAAELEGKIGTGTTISLPLLLDASDGLATSECTGGVQTPGLLESNGLLWVSTPRGLARVDTRQIKRQALAPPVMIQAGLVGDIKLSGEWSDELIIPPGRHRIEVHYTAINFSAPDKVRFRYRLEGLENRWVELGNQRSLSFSYLPPGRYKLHLIASNRDGFWNEEGATLSIVAKPSWWQLLPVQITGVLAAGGLLVLIVTRAVARRGRRQLEEVEREHAIERERTRIAQDLHDDLGASLTRLNLLSQNTPKTSEDDTDLDGHLDRIRRATVEITRSMDEVVWAVNPRHDTLESLVAYLARFAQEFLSRADLRCRFDLPVDIPEYPLTAEFRHNLYLACKETLHNVVRHADATQVVLSLRCETRLLIIELTDDGRGFDTELVNIQLREAPAGETHGNGLSNVRHRISALGGLVTFLSVPGHGTAVRFEVPLNAQGVAKERSHRGETVAVKGNRL